jgi:O-antigen ligase
MSQIIAKYINFALNSLFFLSTILLFSSRSNYFFQNYLIIFCMATVFFIFLSGLARTGSFKKIYDSLNFIDLLFISDFLFNCLAILYSRQQRVSIEDAIYQCGFILIYLIVRSAAVLEPDCISRILTLTYIQIAMFVSKILYVVLYKFQFISVDGRISYNSMHPNLLASYMLIGLSVIVYHIFTNVKNKSFLFHVSAFLITGFTLIMTSSRGGMLGLFLGLLAIFLVSDVKPSKKLGYLTVLSAAALAGIYFIFPIHFQRIAGLFSSENYMTLGSRIHIWTFALKQFALNPLLGLGPAVCNYDIQQFSNSAMVDAHNFLLEKLCDVGIIGTFIYLAPLFLLTREKLRRGIDGRVKYLTIFLMTGLFTNSFFSPHYALPVLSINLYLILALINSLNTVADKPAIPSPEFSGIKYVLADLAIITVLTFVTGAALKIALMFLTADMYGEVFLWLIPVSAAIVSFVYAFFIRGIIFRSGGAQAREENSASFTADVLTPSNVRVFSKSIKKTYLNKLMYPALILLAPASLFLLYSGFYYFAAEKANGLGVAYALNFSARNSKKYFDIAINNDPKNIAYLLNKSFIVFIDEFFRGARLKGNTNVSHCLDLTRKTIDIFPHDQLLRSNLVLLKSKFEGISNFDDITFKKVTPGSGAITTESADIDTRIILQNPHTSFAKFADVFGKNAYSRWTAANGELKKDVLAIIEREKIIKPGTKLTIYFDFIAVTLKTATNIDLPNIADFLINAVNAAFAATEAADKFLPIKGFKEYSLQNTQQKEILSTVTLVLPVIWKHIEKYDAAAIAARFEKMFGSDTLFPIINYFIFNDQASAGRFEQYDPQLKDFLLSLKLFSEKDYAGALEIQRRSMKTGGAAINSILLSWICYKMGSIDEAREIVLFSQFNALVSFRRDFTYKRDLLFGGNIMHFYYLPLQAYYNEFILLALIKMHNGDHSMALREIFDYLNIVVYGGRSGRN